VTRSIRMAAVLALVAAGAAGANRAEDEAASSLLEQVRQNRHRLMSSQTGAPPASEPSVDLDEAARRLREAVRRPIAKPKPAADAAPATGAGEGAGATAAAEPTSQKLPLSPEQLQRIQGLPLKDLGDPIALADSLFLGDHLAEASALYERLLAEGSLPESDRAWCLFQAAGCKRSTDPAGALTLYDRLLAEQPDSLWTEAAKVRKTILQWRQQAQPQALLASVKTTAQNPTSSGRSPATPGRSPTPEGSGP